MATDGLDAKAKEAIYRQLSNSQISALFILESDRGVGKNRNIVRFTGFDEVSPLLYFPNGVRADLEQMGGYRNVSLQPVIE